MKQLILPFVVLPLFALEIVVDTTNNYSVLTMTNNTPFMCKQKDKSTYICKFKKLPSTPVFSTNTLDFKFYPFFVKQKFYIKIVVKNKSLIKSFEKNLYEGYNKRLTNLTSTKKWVIISYKKKIPFLSEKPINGLKFPLEVDNDFYLKAIDANGNPIDYDTQTADVVEYFTILKLSNKQTLDTDRVDEFVQNYPKSIFIPDVLYLKLKLLEENGDTDQIVTLGNEWIKKYAFNEHLPQVLLILAQAYANQGMMEDATYMYERLFTEYQGTKYSYKGMIYLADQLYSAGDNKRAFELYKQAFTNTKDIEVASLAASRIAQRYLDEGNIKESLKYYNRLFKANKAYILKDRQNAYNLANQLASHNGYDLAIKIGEEILKTLKPDDDLYEPLIYRLAKWSYENNNFQKAQNYIDKYLNKFPYGDFADEMKALKDKVLFNVKDTNTTQTIQKLDEIIDKYKNSDLSKKALRKKAQILYSLHKYKNVLDISKKIDLNKTMIITSATNITIKDLKTNKCDEGMNYYTEYNLTLSKKYDDNLFHCAYKVRKLNIASQICNKYLLSDDKTALKWLKNKAKVFEAQNNYQKLALIIDDICSIQKTNCYNWKYKQFFAYYNLNKPKEFLKIASKLINNDNIKNIDIFMKIVLYAKNTKNTLLTYTYSKKILQLQKKYNTYIQSPYIDFTFVNSAKNLKKQNEAIKTLKHLVTINIDEENKARAYYMLSSLTANKIYLKKCIKLKKSKTWMPLCKDSLELYK